MLVTYYDASMSMESFIKLANSNIPIVIFTDPSLVDKFIFPSVKVIGVSLSEFELYSIAIKYNRHLPDNCTKENLSLINTKPEFIKKASELVQDDTFIWIDFEFLNRVKNADRVINKLKVINEMKFEKVRIPGCWGYGRPFVINSLNSRFHGYFFIVPRQCIDMFYSHSKNVLNDFCTLPKYRLTWETNVWYIVEFCAADHIIDWYFGENDDVVLNLI